MKILQVVKTSLGARWALDQAKWLNKHGVEVITLLPNINEGLSENYKEAGLQIIEANLTLPLNRPWEFKSRKQEIHKIMELVKPDLIHCHFVTNILMIRLALRKNKTPRLFQVPGPLHLENTIFRKLETFLSSEEDYWAGACKKTCEIYLKKEIPKHKVFLAYYGGYGRTDSSDYTSISKLKEEFKIPKEKKLVGMVSYFYKPKYHLLQNRGLKGHEDFIDAIAKSRKEDENILGVIIGGPWGSSGKYYQRVKKYAEKRSANGIIFTGFRSDIKEVYKELDLAVHPSHSENLGGAAESLAAGVPTITTTVGGFTDIVIKGETGMTVPPKKPLYLSRAILEMLNNPIQAKKMAVNGKILVDELLDIEVTGRNIKNIYSEILNGGRNEK